jgi:hypothetical protein
MTDQKTEFKQNQRVKHRRTQRTGYFIGMANSIWSDSKRMVCKIKFDHRKTIAYEWLHEIEAL